MLTCNRPSRRYILAVALLVTGAGVQACAQEGSQNRDEASDQAPPRQESTLDEAGRAGLAALKQLAAGEGASALGLASDKEAESATLGQKYDVFFIPLDRLRSYQPGSPAAELLVQSPDAVFPVIVGGQVRSAITVTRSEGGFVASEVGSAELMQQTVRVAPRTPGDFLVRVPALGLQFAGRNVNGHLVLTPITADPRFMRMQPGAPLPAETVLGLLVPIAREARDEPM